MIDDDNVSEWEIPEVPAQWRRLIGYLIPYKFRIVLAFIALIGSSLLSLVFPAVVGRVIDSMFDQTDLSLLNSITVVLIFVFFLRSITSFVETYNLNYVGEHVVVDLRLHVYRHLQNLPLSFFAHRRVGELVSRLSSDVTVMRTALTTNISTLLQQTFIMVGTVIVLLLLNIRLTLFIIVLIPVIVALGALFGIWLRRVSTQVQDEIAKMTTVVEEVLQNIREVKSFVREPYEIERYSRAVKRSFVAALTLVRIRSIFVPLISFFAFGGLSLILWFGGREVLDGRLSAGELITFLIYGLTVAGSFASLIGLYTSFQETIGATRRIFQILDTVPEITDAPHAKHLKIEGGFIEFDNVSFSYDKRKEVLYNLSLKIAPGEIVALIGPSGAGKSTIFNLLPRFYDVTGGVLRVDGVDIREVTQVSLRGQIGIVSQEILLFGGSIRENILYGRLDATKEEMIEASKMANAHNFIMDLPDKYETIVGERGIRLSGGQRQRVAIARALLKDPRILLLDEATSSLDSESENLVQEALRRLMQGRTTVIIAHRLSTVNIAHRIAVLDKGHLLELGTHNELITQDGLYTKLHNMQFRENLS